ncbi:hypothetical protein EYC84_009776 [Monilinia fructicola]|nr:hypothetical protein EYC84_009776 [Monilinia fructicola]
MAGRSNDYNREFSTSDRVLTSNPPMHGIFSSAKFDGRERGQNPRYARFLRRMRVWNLTKNQVENVMRNREEQNGSSGTGLCKFRHAKEEEGEGEGE